MNLQDLNAQQQQAVTCLDQACLVLAGAGSGKTRVITHKIAYLIHKAGYNPRSIQALTFTNKAAGEMKQRIRTLLGKTSTRGLGISTFHSFGLRILQAEFDKLGYRRGFSILSSKDVESCLDGLVPQRDQKDSALIKQTMYQISRWKNAFIDADTALATAQSVTEETQAAVYATYQQHLIACNLMDFDDLIMLPVSLFRSSEDDLLRWQGKLHYLLVDEYQDTNTSQYELIQLICSMRQKLTVVGDDDQSIYSWRGAKPENMNRLQQDFPGLRVIKLEQNYRSTSRILETANALIANNTHVFAKKLWSASGLGEFIRVFPCKNTEDEASRVATDILSKRFQNHASYHHFAILYRSNFQSLSYEKALREQGIPYQISGGTAFFERREIKDIMAYLRLLSNPDDDQALLRIINTPRREIGTTTLQGLANYAYKRRTSLGKSLRELGLRESLGNRTWQRLQRFADLIAELQLESHNIDALTLTKRLITRIDYADWLRESRDSKKQAEDALENLSELTSWIGNIQKARDDSTLNGVVSHLSLMSILENNTEQEEKDAVQLMTLHAAKGLEFCHVYLVGFEEDSLPHHHSQDAEQLEEERRLTYVGITRAQKTLTLSHAKTRQRFGESHNCEPSRFLFELPENNLDGAGHLAAKLSEDEKKQQGLNTLSDLRSMLADSAH